MSVLVSDEELIVTCKCGCHDAIHIAIDDSGAEYDDYAILTYMKAQNDTILRVTLRKLRKIWAIITNKDYYYSEICMNREDFTKFREYINNFSKGETNEKTD